MNKKNIKFTINLKDKNNNIKILQHIIDLIQKYGLTRCAMVEFFDSYEKYYSAPHLGDEPMLDKDDFELLQKFFKGAGQKLNQEYFGLD